MATGRLTRLHFAFQMPEVYFYRPGFWRQWKSIRGVEACLRSSEVAFVDVGAKDVDGCLSPSPQLKYFIRVLGLAYR